MAWPETRRQFLIAGAGSVLAACAPPGASAPRAAAADSAPFGAIEQRVGGRVGVCALDLQTGRRWAQRADERFAMCSTFKWLLAAQVLAQVDQGQLRLEQRVAYGAGDLLEYAPVTREQVGGGSLSVEELARAAVVVSDNTAANLLLAQLGGPASLTRFCRALGDATSRLDRTEPDLNSNQPGDDRDTTSPAAMVELMRRILCGTVLSPAGRERLVGWLRACETGHQRLRAGLPADWQVGDKTGTGNHGACNDVAIAVPPGQSPVLLAVYLSESAAGLEVLQSAHREVAGAVAAQL
ncbi:MAG TPA: class A beta-lactamase [Polyangiaceae bacterium]|nr:class A beta-lactamase [Polyangiaceae bacterium]